MPAEFNEPHDLATESERQAYKRGWDDRVKAVARNWGSGKSERKAASSRRNGFQPGWKRKRAEAEAREDPLAGLDKPTVNNAS
jgi:hypothetical protein